MSNSAESKSDEIKGRAKEAAGALTGNDDLREEGEDDQREAEAKSKVDEAADTVKDGIDSVRDKLGS